MGTTWRVWYALFACLSLTTGAAQGGDWAPWGAKHTGKFCCPQTTVETVEKSCWEVERKEICIPAIRFPWMKHCDVRCGEVRSVKVLKKRTHTIEQCGYRWNVFGGGICPPCETNAPIPPAPAVSEE